MRTQRPGADCCTLAEDGRCLSERKQTFLVISGAYAKIITPENTEFKEETRAPSCLAEMDLENEKAPANRGLWRLD